jgi:hypothetical protein
LRQLAREIELRVRLYRINVARDRKLERAGSAKRNLSEAVMAIDPARLSRLRTFPQRHEDRMERILTRVEGSDDRGDSAEKLANDAMDRIEARQDVFESQIDDIVTFARDLEHAMGNAPPPAPSAKGAAKPAPASSSETQTITPVDVVKLPPAANIVLPAPVPPPAARPEHPKSEYVVTNGPGR